MTIESFKTRFIREKGIYVILILFMLLLIIAGGIQKFNSKVLYLDEIMSEEFKNEVLVKEVKVNIDFYKDPLNPKSEIASSYSLNNNGIQRHTLSLLSVGDNIAFHNAVQNVLGSAKLGIFVIGILFGTKEIIKENKFKSLLKFILMIVLVYILLTVLTFISLQLYRRLFNGDNNSVFEINNIIEEFKLWDIGFIGRLKVFLGGMIFYVTYAIHGILLGSFFKRAILPLAISLITANQWLIFLVTTPLTSMYFLDRSISRFVVSIDKPLSWNGGMSLVHLFIMIVANTIMLIVAQFIRTRKANRDSEVV